MVGGEGLDNEWIEDRLKYCGEGPLDMAEYFQSGCYVMVRTVSPAKIRPRHCSSHSRDHLQLSSVLLELCLRQVHHQHYEPRYHVQYYQCDYYHLCPFLADCPYLLIKYITLSWSWSWQEHQVPPASLIEGLSITWWQRLVSTLRGGRSSAGGDSSLPRWSQATLVSV